MGVKEISPLKQPPLPPTGKGADLNSGFTSMKQKSAETEYWPKGPTRGGMPNIDTDLSNNIIAKNGA